MITLKYTNIEINMKLIFATAIVVIFTTISCKKESSTNTSDDLDSKSVHDNNSLPTNNSSGMPTDSLSTSSQNAATQNTSPTGSSKKNSADSTGIRKN